jgi:AraC family transcriptional regulator of adaptative response / DNA-3-methyladenine glycosylase II
MAVGAISVRLPFRTPLSADCLLSDLATSAIPGLEHVSEASYRRALRLPHGPGIVTLEPRAGHVNCRLAIADLQDLGLAVARCRRMLDLDADPVAADELLSQDTRLAPLVSRRPGRRVPHVIDGPELVTRLLLGRPSARATRRRHAQLVATYGEEVEDTHSSMLVFPSAQTLAGLDPAAIGVPTRSRDSFTTLLKALADGSLDLDVGSDWTAARASLSAIPGVTRLHIDQVAHVGFGDPDAFPIDQRVTNGARMAGLPWQAPRLRRRAEAWRPWRAYAAQHLSSLGVPVT